MNKYVSADVEADGSCPGIYSMVQLGAVIVEPKLNRTFLGYLKPVTENWKEDALKVCNLTRQETLLYPEAYETMQKFYKWLFVEVGTNPISISDNNGFDWQFVNYYFHAYVGTNPFDHSSTMEMSKMLKGVQ